MSLTNAKGVDEFSKNPLSVPRKGSSLQMKNMGGNSDRSKVISEMAKQKPREDLRGKMG